MACFAKFKQKIIPNLKEETDNGATCGSSFRKESCGQNPKLASDENVHRACHYLYQQSDRGEAISHDTLLPPPPSAFLFIKRKIIPALTRYIIQLTMHFSRRHVACLRTIRLLQVNFDEWLDFIYPVGTRIC